MAERYMNGKQAAAALEITIATLYSYVSRGLIRSEMVGKDKRQRRYYAEDVEKLLLKRQSPEKWVESALDWGAPVLDSAITLIADNKLYYRGQDVTDLAVNHTIEEVAGLLWTGDFNHPLAQPTLDRAMLDHVNAAAQQWQATFNTVNQMQMALQIASAHDLAAYDLRPTAVIQSGTRIFYLLVALLAGEDDRLVAERLASVWCPGQPHAAKLINAALILCADHELNASSFTARVIASAGSTPYGAIIGAFSALQGIRHGGITERVDAFLREIDQPDRVRLVLADRMRRGDMIPGFGHKLYPQGDPRAALLLNLLDTYYREHEAVRLAHAILPETQPLVGEHPSVDFALGILTRALQLPPGSGLALFGLGRVIGWIGQIIEQLEDGRLIRPRARYVGIQP